MNPNVKLIPNFLRVLSQGTTSIPKGALWLVSFDDLSKSILPGIKLALGYQRTYGVDDLWQIEQAANVTLGKDFQENVGCVFCAAIGLPGEELTVNPEGSIQANAFIRSYASQGRTMFPKMRMSFLETHVSFCDNFLRPWVVSTSTFGLIGRRKEDVENYRTNIHCYRLGGTTSRSLPSILAHWTFYDACCISVSEEEYNYDPKTAPVLREAQFIYNSYKIETQNNPFITADFQNSRQAVPAVPPAPIRGRNIIL
jgi:hypothetical protein